MAESLFLAVGDTSEIDWLVLDEATGVVRARGRGDWQSLSELTNEVRWSGHTRVLVRSEQTLLTKASIPSRQQRQILQALPFMVEEQIATEIEDCHFAAGARDDGGNVSVVVTEKSLMSAWVDAMAEAGIKPATVTPDVLQVPWSKGISVLVDGPRALVRTGRFSGCGIDVGLLPTAIELAEVDAATELHIYIHPAELPAFQLYLTQIEAGFPGLTTTTTTDYSAFEFLCRHYDESTVNLLQGSYSVGDLRTGRGSGWRTVAVLGACAFGLHVMVLVAQGVYLDIHAEQLRRDAIALYRDVFPNDQNVGDIRRRWQAHLGRTGAQPSGEFFDLFRQTISHLPGANLTVQNVNFNEGRGDLVLQLSATGSDQFVAFAQRLGNAGLQAELGAINQDANSARGSIKVTMPGAGR